VGTFAVVYGGLLSSDLKAGQTVAITGATGPFGSAAVAVALAMGARRVIASGRNATVYPLVATGDEAQDTANFIKAAGEGFQIDVTFDMLPPAAPFHTARAAISALRTGGTAILMGGVNSNVELPYGVMMSKSLTVKGVFMYPRHATLNLLGMLEAGLLDPTLVVTKEFKLDQVEEAVQWAKNHGGPFDATTLSP
jgi:alcohol dehydrogenase